MWRIMYSKYKLTEQEKKKELYTVLSDYTYTCDTTLADLRLTRWLADVCVMVITAISHYRNFIIL